MPLLVLDDGSVVCGSSRDARERLLAGPSVEERRLALASISTAVLQGGGGDPVLLLAEGREFEPRPPLSATA